MQPFGFLDFDMIKVEELTHAYISQRCDFQQHHILTNHYHTDWEADILIIDAQGISHEIEIKLSKSDFKNDFKKSYINVATGERFLKHDKISSGDYVCNHFSFLLPMGMIAPEVIGEHCGIIEFYHNADTWETDFYVIREPKQIHPDPYWKFVDKEQFFRKLSHQLFFKKLELKGKFEEILLNSPFTTK